MPSSGCGAVRIDRHLGTPEHRAGVRARARKRQQRLAQAGVAIVRRVVKGIKPLLGCDGEINGTVEWHARELAA